MNATMESLVDGVARITEVIAIGIIVVILIVSTYGYVVDGLIRRRPEAYATYRARLGKGLLAGLEVLVAADIIRTVVLDPTLMNVAALGLLVVVRTFLSWSIAVEVEGRWPWQRPSPDDREVQAAQAGPRTG